MEVYEEKGKLEKLTEEAVEKGKDFLDWCKENTELVIAFGPTLVTGLITILEIVSKNRRGEEEKKLKNNYIYDRSNGHSYRLKRTPTSKEWIEIDHRRRYELLGDVLWDMGLVKKR